MRGRLKPGVSEAQAAAEIETIGHALEEEYPDQNREHGLRLAAASYVPGNLALPLGGAVVLITLFVSLVLAIACANLAGVLLARGRARRGELAIRIAIGAGRAHLVRQLLTETLLLFAAGAIGGVVVARGIVSLVVALGPMLSVPRRWPGALGPALSMPIDAAPAIDGRVLAFTSAIALVAAIACGLGPALQVARIDPIAALRDSVAGATARLRLLNTFVVVQVGLGIVLLAGAGILIQSVEQSSSIDRGFDAKGVEVTELDLSMAGYSPQSGAPVARDLLNAVRALPGVTDAALGMLLPSASRMRVGDVQAGRGPADRPSVARVRRQPGVTRILRDAADSDPGRARLRRHRRRRCAARRDRERTGRPPILERTIGDREEDRARPRRNAVLVSPSTKRSWWWSASWARSGR